MTYLLLGAFLLGAAVLLDVYRRQQAPLQPGERLRRLRKLQQAPGSHTRNSARGREPGTALATGAGEQWRFYRFRYRLDNDRRSA